MLGSKGLDFLSHQHHSQIQCIKLVSKTPKRFFLLNLFSAIFILVGTNQQSPLLYSSTYSDRQDTFPLIPNANQCCLDTCRDLFFMFTRK